MNMLKSNFIFTYYYCLTIPCLLLLLCHHHHSIVVEATGDPQNAAGASVGKQVDVEQQQQQQEQQQQQREHDGLLESIVGGSNSNSSQSGGGGEQQPAAEQQHWEDHKQVESVHGPAQLQQGQASATVATGPSQRRVFPKLSQAQFGEAGPSFSSFYSSSSGSLPPFPSVNLLTAGPSAESRTPMDPGENNANLERRILENQKQILFVENAILQRRRELDNMVIFLEKLKMEQAILVQSQSRMQPLSEGGGWQQQQQQGNQQQRQENQQIHQQMINSQQNATGIPLQQLHQRLQQPRPNSLLQQVLSPTLRMQQGTHQQQHQLQQSQIDLPDQGFMDRAVAHLQERGIVHPPAPTFRQQPDFTAMRQTEPFQQVKQQVQQQQQSSIPNPHLLQQLQQAESVINPHNQLQAAASIAHQQKTQSRERSRMGPPPQVQRAQPQFKQSQQQQQPHVQTNTNIHPNSLQQPTQWIMQAENPAEHFPHQQLALSSQQAFIPSESIHHPIGNPQNPALAEGKGKNSAIDVENMINDSSKGKRKIADDVILDAEEEGGKRVKMMQSVISSGFKIPRPKEENANQQHHLRNANPTFADEEDVNKLF